MHLLEVVVAVEQRQAPDEGHHHELHGGPGRGFGPGARAHGSHVAGIPLETHIILNVHHSYCILHFAILPVSCFRHVSPTQ